MWESAHFDGGFDICFTPSQRRRHRDARFRTFLYQTNVKVAAAGKSMAVFRSAHWAEHDGNGTPDPIITVSVRLTRQSEKWVL
jgi:hypothetical protein